MGKHTPVLRASELLLPVRYQEQYARCNLQISAKSCDDPDVQPVGRKLSHMLLKEGLFWNLHLYILPKCRIHRKTGGNCCVPVCCIPFLQRVLLLRSLLCISFHRKEYERSSLFLLAVPLLRHRRIRERLFFRLYLSLY